MTAKIATRHSASLLHFKPKHIKGLLSRRLVLTKSSITPFPHQFCVAASPPPACFAFSHWLQLPSAHQVTVRSLSLRGLRPWWRFWPPWQGLFVIFDRNPRCQRCVRRLRAPDLSSPPGMSSPSSQQYVVCIRLGRTIGQSSVCLVEWFIRRFAGVTQELEDSARLPAAIRSTTTGEYRPRPAS